MDKKTLLIINFSHPISEEAKEIVFNMYKDHMDPKDEIKKMSVVDINFHVFYPETLEREISNILDDNDISNYFRNYKHVLINLPGLAAAAVQVIFQLKLYEPNTNIYYLVWKRDNSIPPKFIPVHIATV